MTAGERANSLKPPRGYPPFLRSPTLIWLAALVAAAAGFGIFLMALGQNPFTVLGAVFAGAFGSQQGLNRTIARTIPLLLLSAGLLVAFRAKFWNIGLNGGMIMGAVTASGIALYNPDGPGWLFLPLMVVAAGIVGAIWSLIPGALRLAFGAPEIIVSLMLNYVAQRILEFLAISYWKNPEGRGFPGTANFNEEYWLPRLGETNVHLGLLLGLLAMVGVAVLLGRTVTGLEISFLGQGPATADYLGVNVVRTVLLVAALSGALAGLAGASEVLGLNHRLEAGISQNLGYTAILVVSLGMLRAWATALASLLVAGLLVGGDALQIQFGLPSALSGLLLWAILYAVINAQALAERRA
jgi:general nucleoside transport system permease protein